MQVSAVRTPAVALCAGLLFCSLGAFANDGAVAQSHASDAAKPAAEQSVAVPAAAASEAKPVQEAPALAEKPASSSDSPSMPQADKASAETAPTDTAAGGAKPSAEKADTDAGHAPAATAEPAVQAPKQDNLERKVEDKAAAAKPAVPAVDRQPAVSDAKPGAAKAEIGQPNPRAGSVAAKQPSRQEKSGASQGAAASPSDRHGQAQHRDAEHEEGAAKRKHDGGKPASETKRDAKTLNVICKGFRTYDAERGTYRGYDGRIHSCS